MLKDFKDNKKAIVVMFKGSDREYDFYVKSANGSVFQWDLYLLSAEGRYSELSGNPDFIFPVDFATVDNITYGRMTLSSADITDDVRENTIHFKVIAEKDGLREVIHYGEIWLK